MPHIRYCLLYSEANKYLIQVELNITKLKATNNENNSKFNEPE